MDGMNDDNESEDNDDNSDDSDNDDGDKEESVLNYGTDSSIDSNTSSDDNSD